ncbi:peptidoglycan-binding domain-containing protein [Streptomyces sp. NPDC003042]
MSQHPHEGGIVPDDPYHRTSPAWPLDPTPYPPLPDGAARQSGAGPSVTVAVTVSARHRREGRLPAAALVALALLVLATAGTLVAVLEEPEPEPTRSALPPGLSVPQLPARSPGAGDAEPTARPSARPSVSASVSASPSPSVSASASENAAAPEASRSAAKPLAKTSGTLRFGDSGPEVRTLQERLYGQGFTYVSATGVYDEQTRRGVAQLQRDRDIKGDPRGVYGPATRAAFG